MKSALNSFLAAVLLVAGCKSQEQSPPPSSPQASPTAQQPVPKPGDAKPDLVGTQAPKEEPKTPPPGEIAEVVPTRVPTENLNAMVTAPTTACPGSLAKSLTLQPGVPGDSNLTNQSDADCFAWQQFVALNWKAADSLDGEPDTTATAAQFGDPNDTFPTVWETYVDAHIVFNPQGSTPPAWGTQPPIPSACQTAAAAQGQGVSARNLMRMKSKVSVTTTSGFLTGDAAQATKPPNWLGAQNGTNLWYEVRLSEDEYNYIVDPAHKFYDANQQLAYYMTGPGSKGQPITLPMGQTVGGKTTQIGALELKAAWMPVTDPTNSKWNRYKRSTAFAYSPETDTCEIVTVALVGLHILHKTTSQPTWVWATFEQVDNVPDPGAATPPDGYNLYHPNCTPQQVSISGSCLEKPTSGNTTVTVGCTSNTQPPYNLGPGCPSVPIQVERIVPLSPTAQTISKTAQQLIAQNNPDSVWQYYQLVDVIWSTNPQTTQPDKVPLAISSLQPSAPVANTTMETYAITTTNGVRSQLSCVNCHQYATIAASPANKNPQFGSDFSFVFSTAAASSEQ